MISIALAAAICAAITHATGQPDCITSAFTGVAAGHFVLAILWREKC